MHCQAVRFASASACFRGIFPVGMRFAYLRPLRNYTVRPYFAGSFFISSMPPFFSFTVYLIVCLVISLLDNFKTAQLRTLFSSDNCTADPTFLAQGPTFIAELHTPATRIIKDIYTQLLTWESFY